MEFLVEYDNETLDVYLDYLKPDGAWHEFKSWGEVDTPEDFALGVAEGIKSILNVTVQVLPIDNTSD